MSSSRRAALLAALLIAVSWAVAARGASPLVAPQPVFLPLLAGGRIADADLVAIAAAAEGLLYPSEIDAPLRPFAAPPDAGPSPAAVCAALAAGEPLLLRDAAAFLAGPARVAPGMSPGELAAAARFAELRRLFLARLADPVVCLVGDVQLDVYLLGRSAAGAVIGLRTVVVET